MPGKTPSERKQARDARRAARQKKQKTTSPYAKEGELKIEKSGNPLAKYGCVKK